MRVARADGRRERKRSETRRRPRVGTEVDRLHAALAHPHARNILASLFRLSGIGFASALVFPCRLSPLLVKGQDCRSAGPGRVHAIISRGRGRKKITCAAYPPEEGRRVRVPPTHQRKKKKGVLSRAWCYLSFPSEPRECVLLLPIVSVPPFPGILVLAETRERHTETGRRER